MSVAVVVAEVIVNSVTRNIIRSDKGFSFFVNYHLTTTTTTSSTH